MLGKEDSIIHVEEERYNGDTDEIMLLDISSNKHWMAYVAYNFNATDDSQSENSQHDTVANDRDSIKQVTKMKCQGRAVFLNRKGNTLAIISENAIEVYNNFPKNKTATYVFRLSSFYSNAIRTCETVNIQKTYVDNTSWFNMPRSDKTSNIETLVTFSRHIRHNILTTPFTGNGVVRIWSILENGVRLTSFPALKQHVMAFSKNYKYAAAYVEDSRSVNVYNVKSGLLVYRLKSRDKSDATAFKVSHIRFCYDARYVAMSGLEGDAEVSFEVWYVEAERSIYRTVEKITKQLGTEGEIDNQRRVEPFVRRGMKENKKCLKGYYTSYPDERMTIMCVELDIDKSPDNIVSWEPDANLSLNNQYEIENGLKNYNHLRCGYIKAGDENYLIRFGKHTVQLWKVSSESSEDNSITDDDNLLYIRAYKGPDYGLGYSFRETWEIHDFHSIQYIGGDCSGRLIVNITMPSNSENSIESYHTEEIFLPLEQQLLSPENQFDYHKLESACQALHYLFMGEYDENSNSTNLIFLREKTIKIIQSAVCNIKTDSNFFSTIAGSRTLAMLASFEEGRVVIKSIMARRVPINIFSYARTRPEKIQDEVRNVDRSCTTGTFSESNTPDLKYDEMFYRSSPPKNFSKDIHDTKMIASKENVLTLGILLHEFEEMAEAKMLEKKHITDTENLEAHATMEQIKMYKGFWLHVYYLRQNFLRWSNLGRAVKNLEDKYNVNIIYRWKRMSLEEEKELVNLSSICVVPITHFNSYNNLPEDRPKTNYSDDGLDENVPDRKESDFVRVALDQHISDMFQQGDIVLELLLKYKWQHFARSKFILICFIHTIYYVSYCTGVLFAPELYGQNLENKFVLENSGQIASIALMLTSLLILIIQEARQFSQKNDKLNYFFSGYNWIDISAFVLPIFTLIQLCRNWPQFVEVCSVSTLILWTHAILRLRVISHFGITLETIIQLSKKVAPVLLIMLLVILAFTQSYIVLLRLHPDEYFRDTFSGTFLSANNPEGLDGVVEYATSTSNGFVNWFVAFYNVWLFIYGVWDPIVQGDAGSSKMVMVMSIVFSLIAVLIFFNMVIAIMSSAIEEVDSHGKKVCHFTGKNMHNPLTTTETYLFFPTNLDVVSEIELLCKESILEHKIKLEEETNELFKKLCDVSETPKVTPILEQTK
ncbi:hypothetical protein HPULCUR_009395 [Helicostylum pulchrum]|uniref:Ion transport domain-containing protein n=1 Tax=Helicostylum pulchrum TaxID=562976 RepID=A0ABP9YAB4_9FUNG